MYPKKIVIGAGGQCRVVLSILLETCDRSDIGILDLKEPVSTNEEIMGVRVLGGVSSLSRYCNEQIFLPIYLAIGDLSLREHWYLLLKSKNQLLPNLISKYALVHPSGKIGSANIVCPKAFIGPATKLGSNNLINTGAIVEHEVYVGDHCHLAPGTIVAGRSIVSNRCFVGVGATIIDGITIADGVFIGAGATVTRNAEIINAMYFGVPAKLRYVKDSKVND